MNDGRRIMTIGYAQIADILHDELQLFLRVVQQTESEEERRTAAEQLWATVKKIEALSYAPSEEQWNMLSESQRWGYLRLESYVGTALRELRHLRIGVKQRANANIVISPTSEDASYA